MLTFSRIISRLNKRFSKIEREEYALFGGGLKEMHKPVSQSRERSYVSLRRDLTTLELLGLPESLTLKDLLGVEVSAWDALFLDKTRECTLH